MKRPPPDPAARVFTAMERAEAAVLARENALRHPAPSAIERAVGDVKEGTVIGASIIAHAATTSASRVRSHVGVVRHAAGRRITTMLAFGIGSVQRLLLAIATAIRAVARAFASSGRAAWHLTTRAVTGVVLVLLAVCLGLAAVVVGAAGAAKTGLAILAHAIATGARHAWTATEVLLGAMARASSRAGAVAARSGARSGTSIGRAAVVVRDALVRIAAVGARSSARAATNIGRASAAVSRDVLMRTGAVAARSGAKSATGLARTSAASREILTRTAATAARAGAQSATTLARASVASREALTRAAAAAARSGAQSATTLARASMASRDALARSANDFSRLKVTVRWHVHSARPIVGALSDAFVTQIRRSIREMEYRHALAGLALVAVVLFAGLYGASRRDRAAASASAQPPAPAASLPAALASVAPTPPADAAQIVKTLKEQSAALLTPSAPAATSPAPQAARTAPAVQVERSAESRNRSMTGTLLIASAPKGANVTIDGVPRGVSPLSVTRLRAGNRIVRLELAGYQRWSWAVYVSPARQTRLSVSLVPDSAPPASSAVTNTAAAAK